jgi:hypothetical protein
VSESRQKGCHDREDEAHHLSTSSPRCFFEKALNSVVSIQSTDDIPSLDDPESTVSIRSSGIVDSRARLGLLSPGSTEDDLAVVVEALEGI